MHIPIDFSSGGFSSAEPKSLSLSPLTSREARTRLIETTSRMTHIPFINKSIQDICHILYFDFQRSFDYLTIKSDVKKKNRCRNIAPTIVWNNCTIRLFLLKANHSRMKANVNCSPPLEKQITRKYQGFCGLPCDFSEVIRRPPDGISHPSSLAALGTETTHFLASFVPNKPYRQHY